ncbi:MAG: hypothetical protein RL725_325 [Actinomycetota bacterium]|jgi:Rieske Fe-S protein
MAEITRRGFICAGAAVAALAAAPAVAATGVKTVAGKTVIDLASNKALAKVGGVVELSISKYGKVAVVRTSKSNTGYSVINLSCPHAGVIVKQSSGGWSCSSPRGHGSEFALNGSLKVGPATSALRSIKFTATSKTLTIS